MSLKACPLAPISLPPSEIGEHYYIETRTPIAPEDQSTFQTMAEVLAHHLLDRECISRIDGINTAPEESRVSISEVKVAFAAAERQRMRASALYWSSTTSYEGTSQGLPVLGQYERLLNPEDTFMVLSSKRAPFIDEHQIEVLRKVIALRAEHTTNGAEIAGLKEVCQKLAFEQVFLPEANEPVVEKARAGAALQPEWNMHTTTLIDKVPVVTNLAPLRMRLPHALTRLAGMAAAIGPLLHPHVK